MSRFLSVLDRSALEGVSPEALSRDSGIPLHRLTQLLAHEVSPTLYEVGEIASVLSIDPMYVVRERPAVLVQRLSSEDQADLSRLLEVFDLHVAAFSMELGQSIEGFPAGTPRAARQAGEGLARQHRLGVWSLDEPDRLFDLAEQTLRIPILVWPVAHAPFGATLRLYDTLAIWVNSAGVPGSQQRFTLAHELGHINLRHVTATRIEPTDSLESVGHRLPVRSQPLAAAEKQAQAFAGGLLYDRERLDAVWDGEVSGPSVARVAASLGISYEAAKTALKIHHPRDLPGLDSILADWSAGRAFNAAGLSLVFDEFLSGVGRTRVPEVLEDGDVLEMALRSVTNT